MPIPTYQELMRTVLLAHADGAAHTTADVVAHATKELGMTDEEIAERIPSGASRFIRRVQWARYYLMRADAIRTTTRGKAIITDRGRALLTTGRNIATADLKAFPEFAAWIRGSGAATDGDGGSRIDADGETGLPPEESMEHAYRQLREAMESSSLDRLREVPPGFFEDVVIDLLLGLGYGSDLDAGRTLGRTGDGGVDGVIHEDKLGLDLIYVQAKRWQASVGRPEVQAFVGSLEGKRARKGVIITTSTFTNDARTYAENIEKRVALIDGKTPARLMFDIGLGVTSVRTFEIKQIDTDYFDLAAAD